MKTCHPDALALRICYTGAGRKRFGPFLTSHLDPREPLMRTLSLLLSVAFLASASAAAATDFDIAAGKFKPDWESLESQYQCPDWFRDAKFGIWAHWGPQCQPEQGDWYARNMYMFNAAPDTSTRSSTTAIRRRPASRTSFTLWKAENFDPDKLIALYKRAGAKYFVAMANHHCNFDYFNSKYQPWNSVAIGPKQDLVGELGRGRAEGRPAVRRDRACRPLLDLVRSGPGRRPERPAGRHALRRQAHQGRRPGPVVGRPRSAGPLCPEPRSSATEARCRLLREVLQAHQATSIDNYKPDLLYFDDGTLPLERLRSGLSA